MKSVANSGYQICSLPAFDQSRLDIAASPIPLLKSRHRLGLQEITSGNELSATS